MKSTEKHKSFGEKGARFMILQWIVSKAGAAVGTRKGDGWSSLLNPQSAI
jgi:hypothetical protein